MIVDKKLLAEVRTGVEISGMLPAVEAEVEKMKKIIVERVLKEIDAGELLPEVAQSRWIEYAAAHRLLQRFNNKVRMGISSAERLEK